MKNLIGFATKMYTLWNYSEEKQYVTDSNGETHCVSIRQIFTYIKNISSDIKKVNQLYPNLEIIEDLKGKYKSFEKTVKYEYPSTHFWSGKYFGTPIDDVLEKDFKYCLWCVRNSTREAKYILESPIYISYIENKKREDSAIIGNAVKLKPGDNVELYFTRNGYNANYDYTECFSDAKFGDLDVCVKFNGAKPVGGRFPYIMPIISGKPKKTKGKKVSVYINEVIEIKVDNGVVKQYVSVQ